ncbi:sodium:proton antiporter [Salinibacterium sp. SWN1162]|uniref:cation:proton antiporter n=1 Tax=Salinibacterium sp. SWN1162 TaxID=2792053 RepID=UPI0018CD8E66|nr:cation:proton antiporter [Salinibacterium sp. SWN1162]MBH0008837.1 cation:proton antiporter [Salinibacterium sp. SWN1162]
MTELLIVMVATLVVIATATLLGPRLGVASPLVLVAIGVVASLVVPAFSDIQIDPELILQGILPPLLYSAAVSLPTMNFRREFGAISGLSVILVIGTAVILGFFFMLVLPGLGFAWGLALGAVISPTDAVAVSIIKQTPVSKRVIAMLDGESLLNDATALTLLRGAIVATAATFSFGNFAVAFSYSVVVALLIGGFIGWLNLVIRKRVTDPTVNTVMSFTVPFVAAVPAELLGASGLVAAVVAGLVTGIRAARVLSPQNRLSDAQNWRMIELVLEGAIFLMMGLQISSILTDVENDDAGIRTAVLIAVGALVITVVVRALFVAVLLWYLARRSRRHLRIRPRMETIQERLGSPNDILQAPEHPSGLSPTKSPRYVRRVTSLVTRSLADLDYFAREPLGWREGTTVVWAGMRGAITVAAAQSLPSDTPLRSTLVLIAFAVAALSLTVQGGTIGALVRRISPATDQAAERERTVAERTRLFALLEESADAVSPPASNELLNGDDTAEETDDLESRGERFEADKAHRIAVLVAQRTALLDARDDGIFDADLLENALDNLDATQMALELRGKPGA